MGVIGGREKSSSKKLVLIEERLAQILATPGGVLLTAGMAIKDEKITGDGVIILGHAPKLANRMVEYAKQNTQFLKLLEGLTESTAISLLVIEMLTIAAAILTNHGLLPQLPGITFGEQEPTKENG